MPTSTTTPLLYAFDDLDHNKMAEHSSLSELSSKSISKMSSDYIKGKQFDDDRTILKMDLPAIQTICRI